MKRAGIGEAAKGRCGRFSFREVGAASSLRCPPSPNAHLQFGDCLFVKCTLTLKSPMLGAFGA
jgi:hypothetical protein